jgi:hypothetical protein
MAHWLNKSPLLQSMFDWKKSRIESKEHPNTWWMAALTWPKTGSQEQQANTLAGLHADYIMFILDESGGIPDAVMVAADAALSSCKEGHIVQAGNPEKLDGPLYRACTSARRLWHVVEISGDPDDPKRAPRVSIEWARQMIEEYGRDNPWVLTNVFGRFPPGSIDTLIGPDEVMDAMKRSYHESEIEGSARVLGVDVALYGDDMSVIFPRQGLVAFNPMRYRNVSGVIGAGYVARKWEDWKVDACFVDNTGGFGSSWVDQLRVLGRAPIPVGFSQEPNNRIYANKRAEIYFDAVQWIRHGGQLPPITSPGMPELLAALTKTTYAPHGDRLLLEPKKLVKAKLGYSPDDADALALTFSQPVQSQRQGASRGRRGGMVAEYDPFASFARPPRRNQMQAEFDPYEH